MSADACQSCGSAFGVGGISPTHHAGSFSQHSQEPADGNGRRGTSTSAASCGGRGYRREWLRRSLVGLLLVGVLTVFPGCGHGEDATAPAAPTQPPIAKGVKRFRLVNVTIPPDSPHRWERPASGQEHARPVPKLYVYVLKDGKHLETSSTYGTRGWSVDFPDEEANQWAIEQGSNARFGIQLWHDSGTFYDTQIVSITGLRGEDFHNIIYEAQQKGVGKDRCISFTFEAVEDTAPPSATPPPAATKDVKQTDAGWLPWAPITPEAAAPTATASDAEAK